METKNISYFFIPFIYDNNGQFVTLVKALDMSELWEKRHDEIKYMLKYVADKINSNDKKNCQCFHYELKEEGCIETGIPLKEEWLSTGEHSFKSKPVKFRFQILGTHLYCFSTTVCIIAFKLHFEENDPFWIAAAQYYLKKVSRETFKRDNEKISTSMNFLELAQNLMTEFKRISNFDFFFYANQSTERANVLTYLEVAPQESYEKELFYLRRCYHDKFLYVEDNGLKNEEIYRPSQAFVWGISSEAMVCLACPELGEEEFIRGTFYNNFNNQYLFMYILLLHQKYVLYMFLTKIGIGTYNNAKKLEEYRNQLYEFETDFVFSFVTEVPQYQYIYDKLSKAFSLKDMYEDVHEPLLSLGEMRRIEMEEKQKARDKSIEKSLFMLSLLSFFSALIDSFDYVESFGGWFFRESVVKGIQFACFFLIVGILCGVIINLIRSKK